jgi:hypothetical protein
MPIDLALTALLLYGVSERQSTLIQMAQSIAACQNSALVMHAVASLCDRTPIDVALLRPVYNTLKTL